MILKTKELRKIINVIKPGLSEKQLVPGMTRIIFTGDFIVTYNGQECIHYPLQTDFACSINAKEFIKTIDRIKNSDLDLTMGKSDIALKSGRIKAKYNIDADIKIVHDTITSIMEEIEKGTESHNWVPVPKEFTKAVANVAFAASNDKTKQTQCCIHTKYGYVVAADVHMGKMAFHSLTSSNKSLKDEMPEFKVNAKDALSIINAKVDILLITKAWVHFATDDNVIFSMRKIEGAFPYDGVFNQLEERSEDVVLIKMPKDILEAVETTGIFSDDEDFPISVNVESQLMRFNASSEMGEGE